MREDRSMSWASRELDHANLGDRRRNRRLVKIVEDLAASPESSVPLFKPGSGSVARDDFWVNPRLRAKDLLAAPQASRLCRISDYRLLCSSSEWRA